MKYYEILASFFESRDGPIGVVCVFLICQVYYIIFIQLCPLPVSCQHGVFRDLSQDSFGDFPEPSLKKTAATSDPVAPPELAQEAMAVAKGITVPVTYSIKSLAIFTIHIPHRYLYFMYPYSRCCLVTYTYIYIYIYDILYMLKEIRAYDTQLGPILGVCVSLLPGMVCRCSAWCLQHGACPSRDRSMEQVPCGSVPQPSSDGPTRRS